MGRHIRGRGESSRRTDQAGEVLVVGSLLSSLDQAFSGNGRELSERGVDNFSDWQALSSELAGLTASSQGTSSGDWLPALRLASQLRRNLSGDFAAAAAQLDEMIDALRTCAGA